MDPYIVSLLQSIGVPAALLLPVVVVSWLLREYLSLRHRTQDQLSQTESAIRTGLSEQVSSLRKENHDLRGEIALLSDRVIQLTEIVGSLRDYVSDLRIALLSAHITPPPYPAPIVKPKE
jgi:cell division protein FtsB